jgi:uncharacterized protein YndB with AHSA1/START domain
MHTTYLSRSQSRSISIAAPPAAVVEFLSDPHNLPRWAPAFARSVREQDGRLYVDGGAGEQPVLLSVSPERGTVDIVSAADPRRGAFTRVLPNGDGSEYQFTLFFSHGADETGVTAQMEVVEQELEAVRRACEPGA